MAKAKDKSAPTPAPAPSADDAAKIAAKSAAGDTILSASSADQLLSDVLDEAIERSPEVSPGFDAVMGSADESAGAPASVFSAAPVTEDSFNPAVHETDASGNPIRNADGSLRRKRGRKAGVSYGQISAAPEALDPDIAKRKAVAATCTEMLIATGVGFFGNEWQPIHDKQRGIDERSNLRSAFENYFEAAGTIDLPPSLALAITVGAYCLPRFQAPETKQKAGGFFTWIREKYSNRKALKEAEKEMRIAS